MIFQCDFCGAKSEEESAAWPRRERCRVELVLRGHRFAVAPPPPSAFYPPFPMQAGPPMPPPMDPWQAAVAAMGLPMPPPPAAFAPGATFAASPPEDEDARMGLVLCDDCTSRIAALLGFKIETHEEISLRQEMIAREIASAVNSMPRGSGFGGSWKAEMVDQFPTGERGSHVTTGFVKQWPNPNPPVSGVEKAEKSSESKDDKDKGEFKPMVPDAS